MQRRLLIAFLFLLLPACAPASITPGPTVPAPSTLPAPTEETPAPVVISPTPAGATPPPQVADQFLAYISSGQLLVTNVTRGVIGGTTQYTVQGKSDQVTDLSWSPSGEFIAFVSAPKGDAHVFYVYAQGASTPTDLGPGSTPAWSPDSRSLAYVGGSYPDENIWMMTIDNPQPVQLSFESNHAWGRPAFTPDGASLVVSTADRLNMGAQGNTTFALEDLALDGSGIRTPIPGALQMDGMRLPYDLRFSPDQRWLSFSTSSHLSACASLGSYYLSNADGSNAHQLLSPSLETAADPNRDLYYVGLSYGWMPSSDGIVATGGVINCDFNSPSSGQAVAGPQMSVLKVDGTESVVIPGMFYDPSVDRAGTMIAAAHYKDNQDNDPLIEIYSAQNGQLIAKLGPGFAPQMQP